ATVVDNVVQRGIDMVRRESGFGSRCCGLWHGELRVVRLQSRCRGGARGGPLFGPRGRDRQFRSLFANGMHFLSQTFIAALHESAIGPKQTRRKTQSMSLLGVKPTCRFALQMSPYDPKRTWAPSSVLD